MPDPHDEDQENVVTDLVQHAVVAESDPPDRVVILPNEASCAARSSVDLEAPQDPCDATPGICR
jgi:hypothetical protein